MKPGRAPGALRFKAPGDKKKMALLGAPAAAEGGAAAAGTALALAEPAVGAPAAREDRRTEAERRHDERAAKEAARLVARQAAKTHREKVADFNAHLATLSEHHDIPRVGPG